MKKILMLLLSLLLCACNISVDGETNGNISLTDEDLYIKEGGTYTLSGEMNDASVIVEVSNSEEVNLILDNVSIYSNDFASIYVIEADKVTITLKENTTNTLTSTSEYIQIDDNDVDAVIFSKGDLVLEGSGTLNIETNYKHGIVSKDSLVINDGNYNITSASKAIYGKDYLEVYGGTFNITSGTNALTSDNTEEGLGYITIEDGDFTIDSSSKGIESTGTLTIKDGYFNINAIDDSLHSALDVVIDGGQINIETQDDALHADGYIIINDGNIYINKSHEGLEAASITINGGDVSIVSEDDGMNGANGSGSGNYTEGSEAASIEINGGNIYIDSTGDGIDSNGHIHITDGNIIIEGPTNDANASIDYEGQAVIDGGELFVIGSSGMAMSFSNDSKQNSFLYKLDKTYTGGSEIEIYINDELISSLTTTKDFSAINYSSSNLNINDNIRVVVDGNEYSFTLDTNSYQN